MFYQEKAFHETAIGRIPKEWDCVSIKQISKVHRGASPRPIGSPKYFSDRGRGWVRISDVTETYKYLRRTSQCLSELGESKSVRVDPGDLIMSICATIGKPIIVDMRACIHDGFVVFRELLSRVNTEFLFYVLQKYEQKFSRMRQTGTQGNLNTGLVGRTQFPLPPTEEQEKIAEVLSVVDLAIQKTGEVLAKTERLKKGLMQQLLTRGIGHKEFKDTEMERIPLDWQVISLADVFKLASGKPRPENISARVDSEMPYPVYGGNGIMGYASQFLLDKETVTIGRVGEYCGAVYKTSKFSWITDNALYATKFTTELDLDFLVYLLAFLNLNKFKKKMGQPLLTQTIVYRVRIPCPPLPEQRHISSILLTVDKELELEKSEKAKLERIKQGLMDLLLSGKVRIRVD